MKTVNAIRESFLDFYARNDHQRVDSSPLLPAGDNTLLFTNAGMNQFKLVFTGEESRDYRRACSSQRCVRAGGKHNDLESVGVTARHHTFFEMLGNFSFGDYFKEGAIVFAWDLLVKEWGLDPRRMLFTVFEGTKEVGADDEARAIWKKVAGVGDDRVIGMGMKDNFWAMGDTGPCGPCSEIHYYFGDNLADANAGTMSDTNEDWMEIWNLVFMQYERKSKDAPLISLPAPSIDTGMGLERVTAVVQGVRSNYDTDLFQALIASAANLVDVPYGRDAARDVSLRVLADHVRASSFLVGDGVYPSNEGRGYVLRRIMRRMIRHARLLGATEPVVWRLVDTLADLMGDAHPVLCARREIITAALRREEEQFLSTLDRGMALLDTELAGGARTIPGATIFKLSDTYGFPPDLTEIIARDRGVDVDMPGFDAELEQQRDRSRKASKFGAGDGLAVTTTTPTDFLGYDALTAEATVLEVIALPGGGSAVILDRSPFYAESGGQVGDTGTLTGPGGRVFAVERTEKNAVGVWVHVTGPAETAAGQEPLEAGTVVACEVNRTARLATERNHTATHLLHAALRAALGDHVQQQGSYVGPDRLRFDFSHFQAVTAQELAGVEAKANAEVIRDLPVSTNVYPIAEARQLGAMAFFGDKYGELVRVVAIEGEERYGASGVASREFCGGTHVRHSGEIGLIKIVSESSIASGVRRLEAVTGSGAVHWVNEQQRMILATGTALSAPAAELEARAVKLVEDRKRLQKELHEARTALAIREGLESLAHPAQVGDIALVASFLPDVDAATLREVSHRMIQKLGSGVVVLGSNPANEDGVRKAAFIVQVSKDLTARVKAGALVGPLAKRCGGGGGGRPDMAEAGGKDASKVAESVQAVPGILKDLLGA